MKIGIDARLYGTKNGGIGRYTQELIKEIAKQDTDDQYFIFLSRHDFDDFKLEKNFVKVPADFKIYGWKEQLFFPRQIKKFGLDLMHFTHFNVPFFYRGRFTVTIHDLIISHYPSSRATTLNPLFYKIKLFFYHLVVSRAAKKAQGIIAVSQFTKDDIVARLGVTPEKITVTYEGVNLPVAPTETRNVLFDLGIEGDYLLYVGSAYPHKNLEKLVLAFTDIIHSYPKLQLVLAGKDGYFYQQLKNYAADFNLGGKLIFTGYVNDEQLAILYRQAKAYVFPSLIEGFGLPPLEAQSYDLPVISSKNSCLPEILGDSAVYFDPDNVSEMAEVIKRVLIDEQLRQSLIEQGRRNLKKYSWSVCGSQTLKFWKNSL